MAHPFEKILLEALKCSTKFDNLVLEKAEELIEKGYQREEVSAVLKGLVMGLIDEEERTIVAEAYTMVAEEEE
jgi:hypothetical protein